MKNVVLHRSQLLVIVPDEDVFLRPLPDPPGMPNPAQAHEDQELRYAAWHACGFVIGGANVYAGVCGGHKCYVVVPNKVYDPDRRPMPVLTKEEDDTRRFQEEQAAKKEAKRVAALKNREVVRSRYEIIPKQHCGVNYGTEQRVLIRTKTHVLTWKPGTSSYLDRGAGSVYQRGEFCVMPYVKTDGKIAACNHDGAHPLGYRCQFAGPGSMDIPAPHGFKMAPKNLIAQFDGFEEALGLDAGTLKRSGWTGQKTLVLT
jgi:hypothetical protein